MCSSDLNQNDMRDSARVFISANGGAWQVVATNNSTPSAYGTSQGELPNFVSASSALTTADNQHVQELYDAASWRQARIDLGKWAGQSNLRLRFDFSTAGEFDPTQRDANGNLLNNIDGYAGTTGNFSGDALKSRERGQNNAYEGFYVDDVIIGHAERGEMVTGAAKAQTGFFDIFTPAPKPKYLAEQSLQGAYQLEIRRGTEYASQPLQNKSDIAIVNQFDTNADLVGDANNLRDQGQFIIDGNTVSNAATYGISIDAGSRDAGTNAPLPGVTRNLPVLNNSRLVPGVVVTNNVVSSSGTAGILFSGDPNTGTVPLAAVPFGRIVNNTIVGSTGTSTKNVPVTFAKLNGVAAQGTGVYRTDMGSLFRSISSITIRDNSSKLGGANGKYSGFDLDAIKLSTTLTNDATQVEGLQSAATFDFSPAGTTLALGTQRPTTNPDEIGPFQGTKNGALDNAFATLGSFDSVPFVGPNYRGAVSLGEIGRAHV